MNIYSETVSQAVATAYAVVNSFDKLSDEDKKKALSAIDDADKLMALAQESLQSAQKLVEGK